MSPLAGWSTQLVNTDSVTGYICLDSKTKGQKVKGKCKLYRMLLLRVGSVRKKESELIRPTQQRIIKLLFALSCSIKDV